MNEYSARVAVAQPIRSAMSSVAKAAEAAHELEAFDLIAKLHQAHTDLFELHTEVLQPLVGPRLTIQPPFAKQPEDLPF